MSRAAAIARAHSYFDSGEFLVDLRRRVAIEITFDVRAVDGYTQKAFELLSSQASRDAFDLSKEPTPIQEAYGPTPFAKSCLLARRLVEAGVPMVTLNSVGNRDWESKRRTVLGAA